MRSISDNKPVVIWAGLAAGLASAVAMWIVWYILHLPGLDTPLAVTGAAVGVTLAGLCAFLLKAAPKPLISGTIAGASAGVIGLMLLGSKIVQPGGTDGEFQTQAPLIVATFIASCAALGLAGGFASRFLGEHKHLEPAQHLWLRRLALATAASYVPLITVGGMVTSSGSGMAVPDWPGTYGANMFLYPFALMEDPRIFFEHTHRLLGTLAGLATIVLVVGSFTLRGSKTVITLAALLLLGVIVQGLLGGFRVAKDIPALGALHGILGQGLLVVAVMVAAFVGDAFQTSAAAAKTAKPVIVLGIASLVCLTIQLAFGSLYRHLGSSHALYSHIGFSIIVTGAIAHVAIFSTKYKSNGEGGGDTQAGTRLRKLAPMIFTVLGVQFTLGFAAWGLGSGYTERPTAEELATAGDINYVGSTIATVHQANGALLAALTGLALAWALRARVHAPRVAPEPKTSDQPGQTPQHQPNAFPNV